MEAMEAILSRRSIRKYTGDIVPDEIVNKLLMAAMSAPSANNTQPWSFVVITDKNILNMIPTFHPYSSMLPQASLAIAVCGDSKLQPLFWVQDCSAATENILLAATALGLGAVWLAIYPREDRIQGLQKLLGLSEHITPLSLVPIGYPDEQKPPSTRYDRTKVHYNRW